MAYRFPENPLIYVADHEQLDLYNDLKGLLQRYPCLDPLGEISRNWQAHMEQILSSRDRRERERRRLEEQIAEKNNKEIEHDYEVIIKAKKLPQSFKEMKEFSKLFRAEKSVIQSAPKEEQEQEEEEEEEEEVTVFQDHEIPTSATLAIGYPIFHDLHSEVDMEEEMRSKENFKQFVWEKLFGEK